MNTVVSFFTMIVLFVVCLFAMHQYYTGKLASMTQSDKRYRAKSTEWRKYARSLEHENKALFARIADLEWQLAQYIYDAEAVVSGKLTRVNAPMAIGENLSIAPLFPMLVESGATMGFDPDGIPMFVKSDNGDKQAESSSNGNGNNAKSEKRENQAESTPNNGNSDNAQNRDLATVIVEVGQALKDTLSDKEKAKIKEWLGRETMKNKPAEEYAKNIVKMRNGGGKAK